MNPSAWLSPGNAGLPKVDRAKGGTLHAPPVWEGEAADLEDRI